MATFSEIMEWVTPLEQMFIDRGWEKGLKQGLEQGREEGVEEGRRKGTLALLERQLKRRCGPLPETVKRKLANADLAQLEAWGDAVPEAYSLTQIFK